MGCVGVGDSVGLAVGEEVGLAEGLTVTDMVGLGGAGTGLAGIMAGKLGLFVGVAR